MRLKGIELQGFKSFPDRTKLAFGDGITAVVGPNGSGKSNISDAVRWVFGEQSSKTLRGAKMEDVIFGGTQTRKPQGFAWVSLFIDNTDHSLPLDGAEVVITRKLYRSGESEYNINGNMVRLKDVTELFLDTGLGRDGYSIIGQGRIAEIVGAKSAQRREIFEEAAGIAKFRMRKNDAQRRLAGAEENLIRLRDILGELEGRVGPLRSQAKKAEEYLVYAGEKKTLEVSIWVETLAKLRRQMQEYEDKILIAKNDHTAMQQQLDQLEEQNQDIYRQSQQSTIYIEGKRAQIKLVEESLAKADSEIAVMQNNILHNTQTIQRLEREMEGFGTAKEQIVADIAARQAQLEEARQRTTAKQQDIATVTGEIEAQKARQGSVIAQIEGLKSQRFQLRESVANAQLTTASSTTLIDDALGRMAQIKEYSQQKDENLTRIKTDLAANNQLIEQINDNMAGLGNSQKGYAIKLESRREKLSSIEREQRGNDQRAGELLQKAQLLSDMEKNMEGFGQSVKYVLNQARTGAVQGVVGAVSGLISTDAQYATAIEIALGAAMQNIVVETEQAAKRCISILAQAKAGRATFLPVTAVKGKGITEREITTKAGFVGVAHSLVQYDDKYAGIIQWLLGRVLIAENIDLAVELAKANAYRYKVVTLDGQVVNAGGSLTGGYVAKSAGILGRKGEIDSLRQQAAVFTQKSAQLEEQLNAARGELSGLEASLLGIEGELTTAKEDLVRAGAEKKSLEQNYEEAVQTHAQAKQDYDQLCLRLEDLKRQNLSSTEMVSTFTAQLESIEDSIVAASQERDSLLAELAAKAEGYTAMQLEQVSLAKDYDQLASALQLLTQQASGQGQKLEELQAEVTRCHSENATIEADIAAYKAKNTEERAAVAALYEEIEKQGKEGLEREQRVAQLRAKEKEISGAREQISAELVRLEERHLSVTGEYDSINTKLWDEYELSRMEAEQSAIELENLPAAQRRLTELKNKIRALGTVNVAAVEEYKEVAQRYEFMRAQVDDIEKSKAELSKIVKEITGDMCSIFADKFAQIAEHFSSIFVELFGGGKARLSLTDPNDILESGIDIFVQPPGKLVKNLAALSGGEQAFIAIAIYFAILKVSPAPFCLIDEIEAALDDVNVSKFATYLRKMTKRTQFIAITHRRGTMEEADVLYGVTMQEEGVSKILKLDVTQTVKEMNAK